MKNGLTGHSLKQIMALAYYIIAPVNLLSGEAGLRLMTACHDLLRPSALEKAVPATRLREMRTYPGAVPATTAG
jgi:hypothetical protein